MVGTPRPVDREQQKDKYSGKKKRHTVKNAVDTAITGCILFIGATVSGHTHDKRIADGQFSFPEEWTVYQDTGYIGYRPGDKTVMPFKVAVCPYRSGTNVYGKEYTNT